MQTIIKHFVFVHNEVYTLITEFFPKISDKEKLNDNEFGVKFKCYGL